MARATHLAHYDELTGLPNRRLYVDRFDQVVATAARDESKFGFLVIDLNRFKVVNDTLGHQAGDELLKAVSNRFRAVLRHTDTLARTGGDEFTVILRGVRASADAENIIKLIEASLEMPIPLQEGHYYASASIGASIYPDDGVTAIQLHAVADERMYLRKEAYRIESRATDPLQPSH